MNNLGTEQQDIKLSAWNVKRLSIMAIFIALSAVGALIKIPSPVGTIGMDSAPGFFAALAFGGLTGAIVIAFGHLLTAAVVGFPMTIPIHLYIALQMALWAVAYRWVNEKLGLIPAVIVGIILNGVVSSFAMLPLMGMGGVMGLMPFLVVGAALNVIISAVAYKAIKGSRLI
ncbi:ECF transporter S component [Desulfosporosinus sp. BICA1-9]|uniref:ECF transporter S component n=1 Tax=Desulfosporosinus sp. BICA1-9 TaxID=1531958 RepID=UPI00054BE453|nr:ECF transporter S component [Desulfosporosinus sp. BICA1-9]KJS48444.1 MAG: alpha-ribazole transporter [Peptococcaceae bacterium BRH_c23]KJS78240.1 MAG: alpha-ribazole transporter [Desulfosporosinus sp. BICA1-9]HBW38393.1 alpha-ribazole transporter [Desulfosporosinus sp.]